ncbi:MAG: ATP-binding protein [Alphaproteobacteria bacterium]|nr:ATP-binding protein [Alphaproteobacteria bacterium]
MKTRQLRPRERDAILQSLRAGVVPRVGQQHIQVGRAREVEAVVRDIDRIADGGSAIRFVIGAYGSGKTFFLQLVRSIAMEKKLVAAHADLTPDRRLQASGGQARNLFAELMRNVSTRSKPDGGALPSVVERFVSSALQEARAEGVPPTAVLHRRLEALSELVGGYDFAHVVERYWTGHDTGNDRMKADAVRWLRGEFTTKTDARKALGVRTIVDDNNVYDQLKLMAVFVRLAGYSGLLVGLDEMVNLFKLSHTASRNANYEQILRVLNDSLQGSAAGLGFVMGGTPEFLMDTRRGLYSYEALQTRLSENRFATGELVDMSGPVIRLASLSPEDLFVLLTKLRSVSADRETGTDLVPDEALKAFMVHCHERIGEAYFRTPRNTIKAFVQMLAVLEQNPGTSWQDLLGNVDISADEGGADDLALDDDAQGDDELSSFRL